MKSSRVPETLQAVFLASNRGNTVSQPPPDGAANKVYPRRKWYFWRRPAVSSPTPVDSCGKRRRFDEKAVVSQPPATTRKTTRCVEVQPALQQPPPPSPQPPRPPPIAHIEVTLSNHQKSFENSERSPDQSRSERAAAVTAPQEFLDALLLARGYSTKRFASLDTAYFSKPTTLQRASYHANLVDIVRKGDKAGFRAIMSSGVSHNPCNAHGESLVHMLARKGETDLLKLLTELGGWSVCVCADDVGRTPLHEACSAPRPNFDVVDILLRADRNLLRLSDSRGILPLAGVRKSSWNAWKEYLESRKDDLWEKRDCAEAVPELCKLKPNSRPLCPPKMAFTPEVASLVVSGKLDPMDASLLASETTTMDLASEDYLFECHFRDFEEPDDEYYSGISDDDEEEEEEGHESSEYFSFVDDDEKSHVSEAVSEITMDTVLVAGADLNVRSRVTVDRQIACGKIDSESSPSRLSRKLRWRPSGN